jgi:hypothetical protein
VNPLGKNANTGRSKSSSAQTCIVTNVRLQPRRALSGPKAIFNLRAQAGLPQALEQVRGRVLSGDDHTSEHCEADHRQQRAEDRTRPPAESSRTAAA